MVGGLPVFSRAWGAGKPFDQVVMDIPIASGPYKIGRLNFGRDITYERDPNYWARDLNVRRGRYNFDRVTYKIYKDTTAQTEAFKAGEFDYLRSVLGARMGANLRRQEVRFRRADQGRAADEERRRLPGLPHQHAAREVQGPARAPGARARLRLRVDEPADDVQRVHARARLLQRERLRGQGPAGPGRAEGARASEKASPGKVFTEEVPMPPSTIRRAACATTCARRATCWPKRAGPTATARCATPKASRSRSSTSTAAAASGWSRPISRRSPSSASRASIAAPTSR